MTAGEAGAAARTMIVPLALAQFIASYAATNMNVAISAIATDLGTRVAGVQTAIMLFTLTMTALMIPRPGVLARHRAGRLGPAGGKPSAGKPFAAGLATMMVITLIGPVLGVLIPRQHVETIEPASSVTAAPT